MTKMQLHKQPCYFKVSNKVRIREIQTITSHSCLPSCITTMKVFCICMQKCSTQDQFTVSLAAYFILTTYVLGLLCTVLSTLQ